jgi:PST family polysaccharide transporter
MKILKNVSRRRGILDSLSNIGWLSGDRILRMVGALLVGTLVARYLGPKQFGLLSYGIAIYSLFNIISNLGLDSLVVRDLAIDPDEEPRVMGTAFVLKIAASVVTTVAAILAAWILEPHDQVLVIIVALLSFASIAQGLDVIDYFFQARVHSRYVVVPRTIVFVAASVARVIAVLLRGSLLVFAWIAALEIFLLEIGLAISYGRFRSFLPHWSWSSRRAKALLMESWPLLVSGIMIMLYMRTDQVLLGKLGSMEAVGNYTAAIRFSEIWYAIPMIVTISVMPKLLKSRDANAELYYSRLEVFYRAMVLLSVIVTAGTLVFGPWLVRLLYGAKFTSAANILSIHIWTGIFVALGCVGSQQYVHEGITTSVLKRTVLGAFVNIALNLLWIPRFGGIGSAMATLVAQSVAAYFGDAIDQRTRHIFRLKTKALLQFWMIYPLQYQGAAEETSRVD